MSCKYFTIRCAPCAVGARWAAPDRFTRSVPVAARMQTRIHTDNLHRNSLIYYPKLTIVIDKTTTMQLKHTMKNQVWDELQY